MSDLTLEEREKLIGKLILKKDRCRFDDEKLDIEVIDRMVGRLVDGRSPCLDKYYHADYEQVRELYGKHSYEIWGYIGKLAEKTGDNQFDFLSRYYKSYTSYSYDNFGELLVNTFLLNRSEEILSSINE